MATKKCPVCGVSVKVENLERHVRNQHPHADVDLESLLSSEERQTIQRGGAASRPAITRRGATIVGIIAIVLVVVVILVAFNPFAGTGPGVGQTAPAFTLPASDGGSITLASYRGRPVLLEFMDIDCPHCINEAPALASLWSNYSSRTAFLSVDVNFVPPNPDDATRINSFRTTYNTPWVYAMDMGSVYPSYGVTSTPTMFTLDRNGVVVAVFVGETGYASLASALDKALGV